MSRVFTLSDEEFSELQMIVMDKDKEAAFLFLKNSILKPLELADQKTLDPSKGGSMSSR